MPFSCNKTVLPVLPKPNHLKEGGMSENIPLSAIEDKELRKKLRNRQSALAARERKKARMLELEKQVAKLQECSRRLEEENDCLQRKLEILVRKCIRGGMSLDNDKELLQIAQPFLNQDDYLSRSNSEIFRHACKRKRCIPESHTICQNSQESQEISMRNFVQQNNRVVNSGQQHQQRQPEYGRPMKPQDNKELMANVATTVPFENPTSMQNERNAKPVCQKPFVTIRQSAQNLQNSPLKQKEYGSFQSSNPMQTYTGIPQGPNEDYFKSPQHYHADTNSFSNPSMSTTPQVSFGQKQQVISYDNTQKGSTAHFLPSIGSMLGSPTKCQRTDFYISQESCRNGSNQTVLPDEQRLIMPAQVKPECTAGNLKDSQHLAAQPSVDISLSSCHTSSSSFPSFSSNYPRKNSLDLTTQKSSKECHDFNFNFATRENQQNFFETNLSDIFTPSGDEGKDNADVFNFQDIASVESLSSKSGSDLSIDEHLNWVNDKLVFAF